jgi:hypothetical protein
MRGVGTVAASGSVHAWSHALEFRPDKSYPIWWPGGPFFCHRSPPPEFRRAPLKNQRLGRPNWPPNGDSVGRSRVPCESLVSVLEMASEILMQSELSHLMAGDTFFCHRSPPSRTLIILGAAPLKVLPKLVEPSAAFRWFVGRGNPRTRLN